MTLLSTCPLKFAPLACNTHQIHRTLNSLFIVNLYKFPSCSAGTSNQRPTGVMKAKPSPAPRKKMQLQRVNYEQPKPVVIIEAVEQLLHFILQMPTLQICHQHIVSKAVSLTASETKRRRFNMSGDCQTLNVRIFKN